MKALTFYEYALNTREDLFGDPVLQNAVGSMENFPKENYDKKTIENSLRNFLKEKFDPFSFDVVWKNYQYAKKQASLMSMLPNLR